MKKGRGRLRSSPKGSEEKESNEEVPTELPPTDRTEKKGCADAKGKIINAETIKKSSKQEFLMLPIEIVESANRPRGFRGDLRKGYYRFSGESCYYIGNIELSEEDYRSIFSDKEKFTFEMEVNGNRKRFYLLNQEGLKGVYSFLEAKNDK